jgi:biotin transport system substrate-specific component
MSSLSPSASMLTASGEKTSAATRILMILGFALATVAGARLEIPNYPVPYTLQTLVVLLAGAFLGWRDGAMSQLVYIVAGLAGFPVFAGGHFGLATLVGLSGGYIGAFPIAAALVGYLVSVRRSFPWIVASMAAGLLTILLLGTVHLQAWYLHDWSASIKGGFLVFTWWDVLKLGAAAMIYFEFSKRLKK